MNIIDYLSAIGFSVIAI